MNTINTDDDYKRHPVTIRTQTSEEVLAMIPVDNLMEAWDDAVMIEKRSAIQKANNAWKANNRLYGTRGRA